MTTNPPLYFDTDCLSAFLWIENESILTQLYPGRVMIPKQVYDELGSVPHLQGRIDTLLGRNEVELLEIEAGTPAAELYAEMTGNPRPGHAVIGRQGVFIVNVPNNVVVTTMSADDMKDRIFTNIDSAVIM